MNIFTVFFDKCGPVYALMFAILCVSAGLPRRRSFSTRALLAGGLFFLSSLIALIFDPAKPFHIYLRTLYHFLMFFFTALLIWMCYKVPLLRILYISTLGIVLQHFLYSVSEIVHIAFTLTGHPVNAASVPYILFILLFYSLFYIAVAVLVFKRLKYSALLLNAVQLIIPIILLPVSAQIMNMLIERSSLDLIQMLYYRIYSILVCVSTFIIMLNAFEISRIKNEMHMIQVTNEKQKEQYDMKKELIDLISIRAHDLKKQVAIMRDTRGFYNEDSLDQIEQNLQEYDSMADTGNEVLDIILTDVGLRCEKEGIKLTYLIDGSQLNFMDPMDIHAIFGNLFDNAFESVRQLKDPEKRIISLKMTAVGEMLYFHIFNYYENDLKFEDGLPLTTKENAENHGLGMKSIRMSVRKYGGELTVAAEDHIFNVNFMLCRMAV